MRIKRLEIQGFKSFKDKTIINFDDGITGIVGPNGCGKSNIVDAFFWVMGEQSYKHMRGSGSEDLIFNGSTKYNSLGMAEATLILETGFVEPTSSAPVSGESAPAGATAAETLPIHLRQKEVAVTRRVYRSGEGEYLINHQPARLKDIQELFMDTGVGAKGYSVIEQGKIGQIVTSKPEERRLLIEEAAGIAKYKARKKESLRKMETAEGNLSRLGDILQEIERNLGSLDRQAQKARQYRKYKEELLGKEMTWGRRKRAAFAESLDLLRREREILDQDIAGLKAELSTIEAAISVDQVEQLGRTQAAEALQADVQRISTELTQKQSHLDLSRRRRQDLMARLETLGREMTELERLVAEGEAEVERLEADARVSEEAYLAASGVAQEKIEAAKIARQRAEQARREVDSARRELQADAQMTTHLTARQAELGGRRESSEAQRQKLKEQVEQIAARQSRVAVEVDELTLSSRKAEFTRDELAARRSELVKSVQETEKQARELERELGQVGRDAAATRSRMQSFEELAAAHEGFADGPKAALEWADKNGRSADLIAYADQIDVCSGYEAAVEGWLENRLEILSSNQVDLAFEVMGYLSGPKEGRATLVVGGVAGSGVSQGEAAGGDRADIASELERLKAKWSAAGFEVLGGLAAFAELRPSARPEVVRLTRALFGRVAVVRDLRAAAGLLQREGFGALEGWSLVGLNGWVLSPDGTLRGGQTSAARGTSMLAHRRAAAELKEKLDIQEKQIADLTGRLETTRGALETVRGDLVICESELKSAEVTLASVGRDLHQAKRSLEEQSDQLESATQDLADLETRLAALSEERAKVDARLAELGSREAEIGSRMRAAESELEVAEAELRNRDIEAQESRVAEVSEREKSQSLKRERENRAAMLAERQERLTEVRAERERVATDHAQFEGNDPELEAEIRARIENLADANQRLALAKDELSQIGARLSQGMERVKALHRDGEDRQSKAGQKAIDLERLQSELNHLVQNLEEKYGIGCLDQVPTVGAQENLPNPIVTTEMTAEEERQLGEEVERLRERIRRLGEVNNSAVEEYEELKKRYDHLIGEKADLERSIVDLKDAIEHINKTSEMRFRRAFEAISQRFERLFPIIFGGGQAHLSLVYPEGSTDILEAGVDILAQPPGKKIANISLLSGGEKALTALAMVFAIFMVKPSPFCILDEVDAPLDDSNIGKFNALLKEMSEKSQFILITHNKKTMEMNDTLYGVTMEEPGVSKMVSIQMS